MPTEIKQVRGDERTEELAAKNEKEIQNVPWEIKEWSEANPVHIFNVSPYVHRVEHPMVGVLTIPACPEGERYSKPAILKGMIPYGVCVEMKTVEIRHESGRIMAIDLLGLGPFKPKYNSLLRQGCFIAAADTFNLEDVIQIETAPKTSLTVPRWVRQGKTATKPTEKEIARANESFAENDFALIQEANEYWDAGTADKATGSNNIGKMHRDAARRRGQNVEWSKPAQSLTDCPGCGEKIKPSVVRHNCGAILDWDGALKVGIISPDQFAAHHAAEKTSRTGR